MKRLPVILCGILAVFVLSAMLVPAFARADNDATGSGLVPCKDACTFNDAVTLVKNVINYIILTSAAVAAGLFAYAGFLYMTAGGESGKITKAHGIFTSAFWGFVIMLSAWLVVYTLTSALLKDGYSLLG